MLDTVATAVQWQPKTDKMSAFKGESKWLIKSTPLP